VDLPRHPEQAGRKLVPCGGFPFDAIRRERWLSTGGQRWPTRRRCTMCRRAS